MKQTFADSFFYIAFLSAHDQFHRHAFDVASSLEGQIVTTGWVLAEVADALAAPGERDVFVRLFDRLSFDPVLCQNSAGRELACSIASRGMNGVEGDPIFGRRLAVRQCGTGMRRRGIGLISESSRTEGAWTMRGHVLHGPRSTLHAASL
jgi:hypothetical protein